MDIQVNISNLEKLLLQQHISKLNIFTQSIRDSLFKFSTSNKDYNQEIVCI